MRVALFEDRHTALLGAQENILLLGEVLVRRGHYVVLFSVADGPLTKAAESRGLNVKIVEADESIRHVNRSQLTSWALLRTMHRIANYSVELKSALSEYKIDIALTAAIRPAMFLIYARTVGRIPLVIYAQNSKNLGLAGLVPSVFANRIALIAQGAITSFPSWSHRMLKSRFRLLPSARQLDDYPSCDRRARNPPVRLLTLCSITHRKGIHLLLEMMERLSEDDNEIHLDIVGGAQWPESYAEEMKDWASSKRLPVTFHGWHDEVAPFLQQADVFVMASYDEGLPGALLEAMASGLPCVCTDAGGSADIVRDGHNGFVVPIGNSNDLADRVQLLVSDEGLRLRQGRHGRTIVANEYTLDRYADRFERIASELTR